MDIHLIMSDSENSPIEAVFLYYGILEAYEDVGKELIGDDVVEKYVVKKMGHYLTQFIPDFELPNTEGELEQNLLDFLKETKEKLKIATQNLDKVVFTNENVWELRAAIFGFETVFIEILGEHVIRDYVFARIAEILTSSLPGSFVKSGSLEEKLSEYTNYLEQHKLVKHAGFELTGKDKLQSVKIKVNKCIFAQIHDSEAYQNAEIRFCPWGMIGSAIVNMDQKKGTNIKTCQFVTRGTISTIIITENL